MLSPSFFRKKWTEAELNGLVQMEVDGRKVILPVWYNVTESHVRRYSPLLADRLASNWSKWLEAVADSIAQVVQPKSARRIEQETTVRFQEDVPAWQDDRFKRVGIAYGYLEVRNGTVQFSERFIETFAQESHLGLAARTKLVTVSDSGGIELDQALIEDVWRGGSHRVPKVWSAYAMTDTQNKPLSDRIGHVPEVETFGASYLSLQIQQARAEPPDGRR